VLAQTALHKNGDRFAAFLAPLAQLWPADHLVLVMDNVSDHRSQAMRDWGAGQEGRLPPCWRPVYSPHRHLLERVWRLRTQKLACHRCWHDVAGLEAAATRVLDRIAAHFPTADGPSIVRRNHL